MHIYFNPLDSVCKSVIGAVSDTTKLKLTAFSADKGKLTLYVKNDFTGKEVAYPMRKSSGGFFAYLTLPAGLYWYHFATNSERFGRNADLYAEKGSFDNFQLTVFREGGVDDSNVINGKIIYQIFPDRFCRVGDFEVGFDKIKRDDWGGEPTYRNEQGLVKNNEFFGGNFKGIESKLEYLKSLGVGVVYLNPISKAYSSHRYDTGDYLTVDPVLGTEADLKRLLKKAEKLGISFVFDGVYNHTGADSAYFNRYRSYDEVGAYNSKTSKYYPWYDFKKYPDDYVCWWDFINLPSIKKDSKDFQDFIVEKVLPKYFKLGFKGVRLDVVDELDESFLQRIRKTAKNFSHDNAVIGEVWEDATNKTAYGRRRKYFLGDGLDSVMNYPLKDAIVSFLLKQDTTELARLIGEQVNNYSSADLKRLMNVLSTHDTPRIITVLGRNRVVTDKDMLKYERLDEEQYARGKRLSKIAYVLTYTLYGTPSVYYGDEAGLTGDLDPYNRRCYPYGSEDKDMLEFFRWLGSVRESSDAIKSGTTKIIYRDRYVLVYERQYSGERVFVAVSRNESDVKIKFSHPLTKFGETAYSNEFTLHSDGYLILKN